MIYYEPSIDIMDYIIALYDNNSSIAEKREKLIPKIDDIYVAMKVLDNINNVLRRKLMEKELIPLNAYDILEIEYRELNLGKYLEFKYIKDIAKLGFFRLNAFGMYEGVFTELLNSILQNADSLQDEFIKTDIYCVVIRILVSFDATLDNIDIAKKAMEYYNSLPEEEREITILPNSLTIF